MNTNSNITSVSSYIYYHLENQFQYNDFYSNVLFLLYFIDSVVIIFWMFLAAFVSFFFGILILMSHPKNTQR